MRLSAITLVTSLAFAGAACAADVAAPMPYVKAPAPVAAPIWQGFYIGAMGGYVSETQSNTGGFPKQQGPIAGGTVGVQGQWSNIVLGIEADGGWADFKASATLLGVTATSRAQDTGTVRGRVGVAFDQVLLYGTGGYAWMQNQLSVSVAVPPFVASLSDTQFHSGWTVGGGAEVMFAPRWSVKAEYLYRSFESANYFAAVIPGGIASGTLQTHSGQIGVNYHF